MEPLCPQTRVYGYTGRDDGTMDSELGCRGRLPGGGLWGVGLRGGERANILLGGCGNRTCLSRTELRADSYSRQCQQRCPQSELRTLPRVLCTLEISSHMLLPLHKAPGVLLLCPCPWLSFAHSYPYTDIRLSSLHRARICSSLETQLSQLFGNNS